MAKFYGPIGYAINKEVRPGVWDSEIIERNYYGDVIRLSTNWSTSSDSPNDDLNVDNQISIVADPFAYQNFYNMKFIEFMGMLWNIRKVEPQYPRLILTIGGVYNGERARATTE